MVADTALGTSDEPGASPATRKMNLYKLTRSQDLRQLLVDKVRDEPDAYPVNEVRFGELPGILVSGQTDESEVGWTAAIRSLTQQDLAFTRRTSSAAILVDVDGDVYALTFGGGWRYLRDSQVDREFGLAIAVRLLDPDEIKRLTRWALSAKSRVDRNVVPGGQGLWAFGLREHAELIRQLAGTASRDVPIDLTYVRQRGHYRNFRLTLECGDSVQIPLSVHADDFIADLREVSRVLREVPVNPRLDPLQWVRPLRRTDELTEALDAKVAELLASSDPGDGEVGIAYPARYYEGPDVHRFRGHVDDRQIDTDELAVDDLKAGIAGRRREHYLQALQYSSLQGFDEAGEELGPPTSALHWMAAEVTEEHFRYILLDGNWYELGEEYIRHVEREVDEAFANAPDWALPPWQDAPAGKNGKVSEGSYNSYVQDADERFLCLDRKLLHTRVHSHGFEVCDLLGPANELVHVKKCSSKTGSSVLSHLFAQGLVAVESLTDRDTWKKFRELVAKQHPERSHALDARPTALVYAIHRSDVALEPRTLFTFARSALVSASVALRTYGIPLQIAVIP